MPDAACSVLLVDDNVPFRHTLALVLEDEGVRTLEATRGDEAEKLLQEVRVELFVLDLNLPDTTGVELYTRLSKRGSNTPCVFMTAEASDELIAEALKLQPVKLLRKPFEVKLFRDVIRRFVSN
jgi:DNA-binding response OmpR family regulator